MTSTLSSPAGRLSRPALLVLLVALVTSLVAWSRLRPVPVSATRVERGTAIEAVYATGTIEPATRRVVKARVGGVLRELLVREGDPVHAGDLLGRIEIAGLGSDLTRSRVELEAALAQGGPDGPHLQALSAQAAALGSRLALARLEEGRVRALVERQAAPPSELDRVSAQVRQLEAELEASRAQAKATAIDLETAARRQRALSGVMADKLRETELRAPIDGVVLWRGAEAGEEVGRDQPLLHIGDVRALRLEALVDEADVARVSDGTAGAPASRARVGLYAFPGQTLSGRVTRVLPDAQRDRKAFLVEIALEDPPRGLRPGMTGEVNIVTAEKRGVLVMPSDALVDGQVWVVRDGRAVRQAVRTGIGDLLRTEVLAGLAEGELVIADPSGLGEGRAVRATARSIDRQAAVPQAGHVPNQVM